MEQFSSNYIAVGFWNRQKELLDEAERLRVARRAVREARRAARPGGLAPTGASGRAARGPTGRVGAPPRAGSRRGAPAPARLGRRSLWHAAAARMGSSLVAVGQRLERLGSPPRRHG